MHEKRIDTVNFILIWLLLEIYKIRKEVIHEKAQQKNKKNKG